MTREALRGTPVHDGAYQHRLPATPRSLAELRQTLREWLEHTVDDAHQRTDIVIAASELASAAMRSADLRADAAVALQAWVDDDTVVVESRAENCERTSGEPMQAFTGNDGERGFSIVASLSDVFAVKEAPAGVVVRARIARDRFGPLAAG